MTSAPAPSGARSAAQPHCRYRDAVIPILRLAAVALLLLVTRPALAWNAAGHMVSASIAYDVEAGRPRRHCALVR
jgi:hypothetical protein